MICRLQIDEKLFRFYKQEPDGSQSGSGFSRACHFGDSRIVTTTII